MEILTREIWQAAHFRKICLRQRLTGANHLSAAPKAKTTVRFCRSRLPWEEDILAISCDIPRSKVIPTVLFPVGFQRPNCRLTVFSCCLRFLSSVLIPPICRTVLPTAGLRLARSFLPCHPGPDSYLIPLVYLLSKSTRPTPFSLAPDYHLLLYSLSGLLLLTSTGLDALSVNSFYGVTQYRRCSQSQLQQAKPTSGPAWVLHPNDSRPTSRPCATTSSNVRATYCGLR